MSHLTRRPVLATAAIAVLGAALPFATAIGGADAAPAPADSAQVKPAHVLGHRGAGALRLGDSVKQARRDGAAVYAAPDGGCRTATLPGRSQRGQRTDAYLAPKLGVVAIFARADMHTPEGVRLGSTLREVRAAYPDVSKAANGYREVRLGGHRSYQLGFDQHRRVVELLLLDDRQICFG